MTPPFYLFLIASACAVIVFRLRRTGGDDGVYRMPLFPLPPLVIIAASAFMTYSGVDYILFKYTQQGAKLLWPIVWVAGTFVSGVALAIVDRKENAT